MISQDFDIIHPQACYGPIGYEDDPALRPVHCEHLARPPALQGLTLDGASWIETDSVELSRLAQRCVQVYLDLTPWDLSYP